MVQLHVVKLPEITCPEPPCLTLPGPAQTHLSLGYVYSLDWSLSLEHLNGALEWSTGMEHWSGALEWIAGVDYRSGQWRLLVLFFIIIKICTCKQTEQ